MGRRAAFSDAELLALAERGLKQSEIAARLGVGQPAVSKRLGRLGLRRPEGECAKGHALTPENLDPWLLALGKRRCAICARDTSRDWKERRRREAGVPARGTRKPSAVRLREQRRMWEAARRARKFGQFVEHVDPQVVWERDEGICGICGEPAVRGTFQVDHIVALANGGPHSYANVQVSHPPCNNRKGAR